MKHEISLFSISAFFKVAPQSLFSLAILVYICAFFLDVYWDKRSYGPDVALKGPK